jgi:hypothetical protein
MKLISIVLTFAFLFSLPGVLLAQGICGPRESITSQLAEKYGEVLQSNGLNVERVMEVWANPATGTWTMTLTSTEGVMCIYGAGTAWQNMAGDPA